MQLDCHRKVWSSISDHASIVAIYNEQTTLKIVDNRRFYVQDFVVTIVFGAFALPYSRYALYPSIGGKLR